MRPGPAVKGGAGCGAEPFALSYPTEVSGMILDQIGVIDAEPVVRTRLTAEEFMTACEAGAFGDLAHIELIDGELVEMPPEGQGHAANNGETYGVLWLIVRRLPGLEISSNMGIKLGVGRVVGPDVVVFEPDPARPSLTPASVVKLAIEHAYSSRSYDLNRKARLYAEAGVPEYWVLDNVQPQLHRFHSPADGVYQRDPPLSLDQTIALPFAPDERVRVGDLFRTI